MLRICIPQTSLPRTMRNPHAPSQELHSESIPASSRLSIDMQPRGYLLKTTGSNLTLSFRTNHFY